MVKDYPILKNKVEKCKQKAKKDYKKVIIATWSDSDSSDSDDAEEQAANLYFLVKDDQVQEDETEH